tara:strand:+ start:7135 stop:7350 length:216 start_codon:yes stop_codon:yes gene_type:complete
MNSVPNDNIIELRRLTEKFTQTDKDNLVINTIEKVVESCKFEIEIQNTYKSKLKVYELMLTEITNLIVKLK